MSNWTEEERAEALKRRLQGKGVMDEDAAAALGGGLRFVSKGEQEGGEMKEDFAQAEQYDGFREGYVFKKGSQGLGYYRDRGPKGPWDPFDVNTGVVVRDREYDMDKHIRGERQDDDEEEYREKQPGEGRVGALGDLLAENKNAKQEAIDQKIHDNRFCPPKALDEEEYDFLAQKAAEKKAQEAKRKQQDLDAAIEFKVAQANQGADADKPADLSKLFAVQKKEAPNKQHAILSRIMKRKDVADSVAPADEDAKKAKTGQVSGDSPHPGAHDANAALLGLGDYSDSD